MDIHSYVAGLVGGVTGILGSHPIDTIKVIHQDSSSTLVNTIKSIYNKNGFRGFYRGMVSPLFGIGIEKAIVFGTYSNARNMNIFKNDYGNIFFGGVIAGLFCTTVVIPVEKIKIRKQKGGESNIANIIRREGIFNLYRGWSATLFRDTPGYGIYFMTYEYLKKNTQIMTPFHTATYGACAGGVSWLFIYPSDPIKTMMQYENTSLIEASKKIYSKYGIRGFYRGFGMGLFQALPRHGCVFLGVETYRQIFNL
tara:strand:+ start:30952 stop:31710 length:759 start_codon:yes stop_codon:yes gene_type:complete